MRGVITSNFISAPAAHNRILGKKENNKKKEQGEPLLSKIISPCLPFINFSFFHSLRNPWREIFQNLLSFTFHQCLSKLIFLPSSWNLSETYFSSSFQNMFLAFPQCLQIFSRLKRIILKKKRFLKKKQMFWNIWEMILSDCFSRMEILYFIYCLYSWKICLQKIFW